MSRKTRSGAVTTPHQHVVASRASRHHPGGMVVHAGLADHADVTAAGTPAHARPSRRARTPPAARRRARCRRTQLPASATPPPRRTAVGHRHPPVGPKRSVRMRLRRVSRVDEQVRDRSPRNRSARRRTHCGSSDPGQPSRTRRAASEPPDRFRPAVRRLAGVRVRHVEPAVVAHPLPQLVGVDRVVRACAPSRSAGTAYPADRAGPGADHRHQRHDAGAAGDSSTGCGIGSRRPDEVAADRPAQLDLVTRLARCPTR